MKYKHIRHTDFTGILTVQDIQAAGVLFPVRSSEKEKSIQDS